MCHRNARTQRTTHALYDCSAIRYVNVYMIFFCRMLENQTLRTHSRHHHHTACYRRTHRSEHYNNHQRNNFVLQWTAFFLVFPPGFNMRVRVRISAHIHIDILLKRITTLTDIRNALKTSIDLEIHTSQRERERQIGTKRTSAICGCRDKWKCEMGAVMESMWFEEYLVYFGEGVKYNAYILDIELGVKLGAILAGRVDCAAYGRDTQQGGVGT